MRLNKFIGESGICSRREADRFIERGVVFINKRRAVVGDKVNPGDKVCVNGIHLEPRQAEDVVFIALNKPVGITCTTETTMRDNIVSFVNHSKRLFPIGRLDKDSQGLIFLTNNGNMVNKILRAGNKHEKEYLVTINKPLTQEVLSAMANGVPMLGVTTKRCKVVQEGVFTFRIVLVQGLNRQIRRMCEHFGYEVVKLERVRIMNVTLKGIPLGDWRDLTDSELEGLYGSVEKSKGEPPNTPRRKKPFNSSKFELKKNLGPKTSEGARKAEVARKADGSKKLQNESGARRDFRNPRKTRAKDPTALPKRAKR